MTAIPQNVPTWIERLLTQLSYSCAEPHFVHDRQEILRKWVLEAADAEENGRERLRTAAVRQLASNEPRMIVRALSCLFVVGTVTERAVVQPLLEHSEPAVRKAARCSLFEMQRRNSPAQK